MTRQQWEAAVKAARVPFGAFKTREVRSATHTRSLPGAPDGEYVVIQYATQFEHKADAVETVTPMLDQNEPWKVSGYFIQ